MFRLNLPTGPVTWQTAPTAFGHGQYFVGTNIHPALLVAGDNVLAAELHSGSSDRVFDAMLWAQPGDPPPLSLTRGSAGTIRVSWPAWAPDYRLQSRTNLGAGEWQDVTNAPSGDGLVW